MKTNNTSGINLQYYINVLLHKLYIRNVFAKPNSFTHKLVSTYFVNNEDTRQISLLIKNITSILKEDISFQEKSAKGTAIVFLLKGHFYIHNIHNYIIAHILKNMGYKVYLATCNGDLERCGNSQQSFEFRNPPFACKVCRDITSAFDTDGFFPVSLNEFQNKNEDELIELFLHENNSTDLGYKPTDLLALSSPYLLRFFNGDFRKITLNNEHSILHLKSASRLMLRYQKMLNKLNPDLLVLFNGTFFPEHLFIAEAEKREIRYFCTERGMKRDSLFISFNMPATNYNAGELWNKEEKNILADQLKEAEEYLKNRMKGPEDPTGTKRNLPVGDIKKYEKLAEKPYAVFFAPVTHDTASMGKNNLVGDIFKNLKFLAESAINFKRKLVIRCHPDELSNSNPSHYTLTDFLKDNHLLENEYIKCLSSNEVWNPYMLAQYAHSIIIYNGTLGIELPALGYKVFNLGMSHYREKGFTTDFASIEDIAEVFKFDENKIENEKKELALRYLYYYLYISNLTIDAVLHEERPFVFSLSLKNDTEERKRQLMNIYHRIIFYESLSNTKNGY